MPSVASQTTLEFNGAVHQDDRLFNVLQQMLVTLKLEREAQKCSWEAPAGGGGGGRVGDLTLDDALEALVWSQKDRRRAIFQTFETFQMLCLYRRQHGLINSLAVLDGKPYFGHGPRGNGRAGDQTNSSVERRASREAWDKAEEELKQYCKSSSPHSHGSWFLMMADPVRSSMKWKH